MTQQFLYKAMDSHGHMVRGQLDANNAHDLEVRLDRMGLDLVHYRIKRVRRRAGNKINRQELITFCFHMEQLTRAGVPLVEGLEDLRDSLPQTGFRDVVSSLIENIQGGSTLSESMKGYPGIFNEVFVSLVAAGEESGNLATVFEHMTENLKWQDEMIAKTRKLLMYPLFVGVVVLGVLTFLMTYLVPQLRAFIQNIGGELPFYTLALLALSDFFVNYWYIVFGLPVILLIFLKIAMIRSHWTRVMVDHFKLKVWMVGPIMEKIILARFARFFGLMYSSGVTILDGLAICKRLSGNLVIEEALQKVHDQISDGSGISESFEKARLFPPLVLRMVKVGESTGDLDAAMANVGYFYDREVKESMDRLQVMIEPTMTVIMGLLLGWIMAAVLLPVYDSISQFAGA